MPTPREWTAGFDAPLESGRFGRVDGDLKVAGRMPFAADLHIDQALHAAALRSPLPHARIRSINVAPARALAGVRAVLTGADVPNVLYGRSLRDAPLLATGKVRFAGEAVAVVAAETREIAVAAANRIEVEYEPLLVVLNVETALDADAPSIHDNPAGYPGAVHQPGDPPNLIAATRSTNTEDIEAALARSDRVFEHTFRTQRVHQGYLEPNCCTVVYDPSGRVRVWATNKSPYRLREQLADAFDLPAHDIELFAPAIGGDFGGKGSPMDVPLCLELSRRTGRPVRMVRDYRDELTAGYPAPSSVITIRLGLSDDGCFQALDVRGLFAGGAYGGFTPNPAFRSTPATSYRVPAAHFEMLRIYTNEAPNGNMRAPGAPQVTFAMEGMIELVAREIGLDSFELRRRNVLTAGDANVQGHVWPEVRGMETLQAAERAIASVPKRNLSPTLRFGRGVALYDRPTHLPQPTSLRLRLLPDGRVEAQVAIMETGTGSHTMLQRVVAKELQLDPEQVVVRYVATPFLPHDEGVGGSRVTVGTAEAATRAAHAFREALANRTDGHDVEALGEVTSRERGEGVTSFCAQVADVAVDIETGEVTLLNFVSAHDVAEILNPLGHRGQIHGGIVMGLGFALCEDLGLVDGRV